MSGLRFVSASLAAGLLAACSMSSPAVPPGGVGAGAALQPVPGAAKIKHIVYVIQEGRSFNTLFEGYPGADTVSTGELSDGTKIPLKAISLKTFMRIDSSADGMFLACNGRGKLPGTDCRMNGFDKEWAAGPKHLAHPQYVYVNHDETKPYFAMAHEWVLADHMFASQLDDSFIAHQYAIAAQADRATGLPDGYPCAQGSTISILTKFRRLGGVEKACFSYQTLGGELDAARLNWRYYFIGSGFTQSPYGFVQGFDQSPDARKHIVSPPTRFLSDVKHGKLAGFSWVTPTCADSDDSGCGQGGGPAWVASIVNAISESKFWDSTAIFVQWDDWGGFYDNVAPKYKNFDSLGFRVPLLVISPYAKENFVSHRDYESASVLRFAEDLFGLSRLSTADARARSPANDCFDFNQAPRKFVPIKT